MYMYIYPGYTDSDDLQKKNAVIRTLTPVIGDGLINLFLIAHISVQSSFKKLSNVLQNFAHILVM